MVTQIERFTVWQKDQHWNQVTFECNVRSVLATAALIARDKGWNEYECDLEENAPSKDDEQ